MRNDQVKISFGPARYDSPKAIRRQIEDAKQETQESTIQEITNNTDLNIAGGAQARSGEVVSYTPGTGQGVAIDEFGETFTFINGTGSNLAAGDDIVAIESGDDYVAIGVTYRTGQVVPVDQPIGYLDPDFPIISYDPDNTGQLPLEILGFGSDMRYTTDNLSTSGHPFALGYDVSGVFGAGSDLIYGRDNAANGSINGFSRGTATNVSLFPNAGGGSTPGDGQVQFMQPNGRAVSWSIAGNDLWHRMPGDPGWTSESGVTGTTTGTFWAGDPVSGAVWGFKLVNGTPDTIAVYRLLPTDATIQSVGNMGIIPTSASANFVTPTGGNGFITFMFQDGSSSALRYYVKPAGDTSNFTNCGTFSSSAFNPGFTDSTGSGVLHNDHKMAVSPLGETSYVYRDAGTGTLHIRLIDQTAVIYDNDTGIPVPANLAHMHTHLSSGLVAVVATMLTTDLGDTNPNRITAALATYNYATTSYQYYDINKWNTTASFTVSGTTGTVFIPMSGLQEVLSGEVRYCWGTNNGTTTTFAVRYVEIVGVGGL